MNSPKSVLLYALRHTTLLLTGLTLALAVRPSVARAQQLYWSHHSDIWRGNVDGTGSEIVMHEAGPFVRGMTIEPFSDKIYWTANYAGGVQTPIRRANLDGSEVEELLFTAASHRGIAVDPTASKMYWFELGGGRIRRANTDGSNIETLITVDPGAAATPQEGGIALDIAGGKMYWTNLGYPVNLRQRAVSRADLDGSNVEDIVINEIPEGLAGYIVFEPMAIALDLSARKVYWTETALYFRIRSRIRRANLDGSEIEDLVDLGHDSVSQIALDLSGGKMYWASTASKSFSTIKRANLDGSNVEIIRAGLLLPIIAIDPGCRGEDCQLNGIPDPCDIEHGISADCNANDIPDECEADCNDNGITDDCETDSDGDGVIDECDGCPLDPERTSPGLCGCNSTSEENADDDGDSIPNCIDACPGVDDAYFGPCQPALIPTVSQWGLLTMCLLLLTAGKVSSTRPRLGVCVRRAG